MKRISAGFTLIELLIVISISAIFLTVSLSGYRDFSRRQEQQIAKRTIVTDLREAQKSASTGYKPTGCTGTLVGFAFEVVAITSPVRYEISAICTNPLGGANVEFLVKSTTLSPSIFIRSAPTTNPIVFNALGRGTNIPTSPATGITLNLASTNNLTGATYDLSIAITTTGEIK